MNAPTSSKARYPSKAKVAFAIRCAHELAGIEKVGAIEIGPDGTVRVTAANDSVADEFTRWFPDHGDRS